MAITEDLATITRQEAELQFPAFDYDTAWRLGLSLRELALSRKQSIVVDIRRFGQPHQQLFYTALAGTTPDNHKQRMRLLPSCSMTPTVHGRCQHALYGGSERSERGREDRGASGR